MNGTCPPFESEREPVTAWPEVEAVAHEPAVTVKVTPGTVPAVMAIGEPVIAAEHVCPP